MGNEAMVVAGGGAMALSFYEKISDPMDAVLKMGEFFSMSGMFGCTKKEQGHVLAMACFCEKKNPLEIMRKFHLIEGKLAMRADAMLAEYRSKGGKVCWKQMDENGVVANFTFEGQVTVVSFTIEDAKRAGLIPAKPMSAWMKYPADMMRARVIARAVRMVCPEAIVGCYTEDELQTVNSEAPIQRMQAPTQTPATKPELKVVKNEDAAAKPADPAETVQVKLTEVAPGVTGVEEVKPAKPAKTPEPISKPAEQAEADEARLKKIEHIRNFYTGKNLTIDNKPVPMLVDGEPGEAFMAWLVGSDWLKAGQKLVDLPDAACERILARMDALPRAIESKKYATPQKPANAK